MGIIYLMLIVSLVIALFFLLGFFWATKSGQYEDDYTPSVRILFDDEISTKVPVKKVDPENKKQESNGSREV